MASWPPFIATPLSAAMPVEADERAGLREALLHGRDQRLAAAERLRLLGGERLERFLDRGGPDEFECVHRGVSYSAAWIAAQTRAGEPACRSSSP